nr:MAG TPA: minor tail protein [Caudoviricetes sp.]
MADKFQLKAILTGVDQFTPMLKGAQKKVLSMRKSLLKSGFADFSIRDVITGGALATPFVEATRTAIDFESAMADVRKVVDFPTPEAFKQMSVDIIAMSAEMPMAADGIAAIVAAGGQAGIASEDLKQFAADAVRMGIAFDQTAEESGDMMAKWRTSFRLTQNEVVALADKINYLSNTGAANAQQISNIVTRIGPLGEVAGLASGEIAAMGATLAGVGIQEEVAATGMKNFMLTLTSGKSATAKQAQMFKALRMDAEGVAAAMQSDASGTMLRVLDAIAHVDKTKQAAVLSTLFGRESIGAIAPLLTNIELLRQNFERVGDASQYAGSMQAEYETRSRTTANALQQLKNQTTALGISVGNVLLPPIVDFTKAVAPLLNGIRDVIEENPWLIKGLLSAGAALLGVKTALFGVATAMKLVSMFMGGPWTIAIKAIIMLVGALIANWKEFSEMVTNGMNIVREFLHKPRHLFGSDDATASRPIIGDAPNISGGRQEVGGEIVVRLENAQPGTRVEQRSEGPVKLSTDVGYRTLAYGGN